MFGIGAQVGSGTVRILGTETGMGLEVKIGIVMLPTAAVVPAIASVLTRCHPDQYR